MQIRQFLGTMEAGLATSARFLAAPCQLAIRGDVGSVILKSGWLKLSGWSQTRARFQSEYHAPLLPPPLAAIVGTAGRRDRGQSMNSIRCSLFH